MYIYKKKISESRKAVRKKKTTRMKAESKNDIDMACLRFTEAPLSARDLKKA